MRIPWPVLSGAEHAPGADPRTGARPLRDAWVWAVLPETARRIGASGGSLGRSLAAAGLDAVDCGAGGLEALVVDADPRSQLSPPWGSEAPLVAVLAGGGPDVVRERASRARRAAQLTYAHLGAPAVRLRCTRVARAASAAGRSVATIPVSDLSGPYALGRCGLRHPQAGGVVIGWAGQDRPPTACDAALVIGTGLTEGAAAVDPWSVVESGKLLTVLRDPAGRPYAVARVAGGAAGALITRASAALAVLRAPGAPDNVRAVLPPSLAAGRSGVAAFSIEGWVGGRRPDRVDDALWRSCCGFLESLRAVPCAPELAHSEPLANDVELLAGLLEPDPRQRLARVARLVDAELAGVPTGWAHGDFWPENLVAAGGRLLSVLDWDTASSNELPGLDALDLIGFAAGAGRWMTFGPRLVRIVLPLARERDRRLVAHFGALEAPSDQNGLEAAAWAWWLRRVALTVRDYPDRRARPAWLRENLVAPLMTCAP